MCIRDRGIIFVVFSILFFLKVPTHLSEGICYLSFHFHSMYPVQYMLVYTFNEEGVQQLYFGVSTSIMMIKENEAYIWEEAKKIISVIVVYSVTCCSCWRKQENNLEELSAQCWRSVVVVILDTWKRDETHRTVAVNARKDNVSGATKEKECGRQLFSSAVHRCWILIWLLNRDRLLYIQYMY